MSQQEFEYTGPSEHADPAYGGYGSVPPPQQSPQSYPIGVGMYSAPSGQKIWEQNNRATPGQRLALGIVSIVAFFGLFIVSLAVAAGIGDGHGFAQFILMLGLVFSFAVVIVINALYNRRA